MRMVRGSTHFWSDRDEVGVSGAKAEKDIKRGVGRDGSLGETR